MHRYNIFIQVHKGLRAMLYQTAEMLQQTDFNNTSESDRALDQVLEVLDLFDKHAESEDNFIMPAIEKCEPGLTAPFKKEHEEDYALSSKLRVLLNIFYYTTSACEKNVLGTEIHIAFVEFLVFNLKHMAGEELLLNNCLCRYYTDGQLGVIMKKIMGQMKPELVHQYRQWMMVGLNNNEIIQWLKDVRSSAPDFVFEGLVTLAEGQLPRQRWEIVRSALLEQARMAS